jgi:uncharacterized protein (TIGR03086 family)
MWTVMTEALELLTAAAAAVTPEQQDAPTPCSEWTVTQVLQHAAGDQLAWAAALGTGSGPDYNPFEPSGSFDGRPDQLVAPAVAVAEAAWATVTDASAPVPTPLPQGQLPAPMAAAACALDAAVHAWDVLAAVGQAAVGQTPGLKPELTPRLTPELTPRLTPELAAQLLPAARAIVEPLRQYGAYAAALAPEPDDDAAAELLRYLGRDPSWRMQA